MQRRQKPFWRPALLTLALMAVLKFFHLDATIPFLNQLLANQDPPGIIALLVLSLTLFCLLRLLFWYFATRDELHLIHQSQRVLKNPQAYQQAHPGRVVDPLADIQKAFA